MLSLDARTGGRQAQQENKKASFAHIAKEAPLPLPVEIFGLGVKIFLPETTRGVKPIFSDCQKC
jgi:hypothetical protein